MKILIIDDEPSLVGFLRQLAQNKGYTEIDAAASGEEALTQVIRNEYDLITLDLRMPGLNDDRAGR